MNHQRLIEFVLIGGGLAMATSPSAAQESERMAVTVRVPFPPPPIPPARKSPTDLFRELLSATPAGRDALLAGRSAAARNLIDSKLREFELLPPDQRELRLCVAELQFYLSPLLQAESGARPRLLAAAPVELRPLLEERLAAWNALPENRRRDLLDSEQSLAFFIRLQLTPPTAVQAALLEIPESRRAEMESQLTRWQGLTPEQRAQKTADFQRFFELRASEQRRILNRISPAERAQMERTLKQFHQLPADQRERAVRGFRRFLEMPASDRAAFLQNAEKWQSMTPDERDAWRRVVERATHPAPLPMPPESRRGRGLAMTNSAGP